MSRVVRLQLGRALLRALPFVALVALTGTLASALQVREIRVSGAHRFPARDIENALRHAIGVPALAARASELRTLARQVPWVADATVQVSLDGIVACAVTERTPVAVAVDGDQRLLLDGEGRTLAPAGGEPMPELHGFAGFPEERALVLAAYAELERRWGARLTSVERVASRDVALSFADASFPVLADPSCPAALADGRRVLVTWLGTRRPPPARLDVRVAGRVAVLPATLEPAAAQTTGAVAGTER